MKPFENYDIDSEPLYVGILLSLKAFGKLKTVRSSEFFFWFDYK